MKRKRGCTAVDHTMARRSFLGTAAAATGGLMLGGGPLLNNAVANTLEEKRKQMLIVFLDGGLSQFESWDPKPGVHTGGPFRAIPTSVPGLHISELMPYTAQQMHHLAVVRSLNTKEIDHAPAKFLLETGRRKQAASDFPYIGAAVASKLARSDDALPPYVICQTKTYHPGHNGFLDSRFAGVNLVNAKPPQNIDLPKGMTEEDAHRRAALRTMFNQRFASRNRNADTTAYAGSYDLAARLMDRRDVFDVTKESAKDAERYGSHDFGRNALLARRLVESGVPVVQLRHTNYDSHVENFNYHIEQLGEFDRTFASLVEDLADRGLLENTLLVCISEMGRTPMINRLLGRDHWGRCWSMVMGGCGIQKGAVYGATNKLGFDVAENRVTQSDLFHTFYSAIGLDGTDSLVSAGQEIPMAEPGFEAIDDLLL